MKPTIEYRNSNAQWSDGADALEFLDAKPAAPKDHDTCYFVAKGPLPLILAGNKGLWLMERTGT